MAYLHAGSQWSTYSCSGVSQTPPQDGRSPMGRCYRALEVAQDCNCSNQESKLQRLCSPNAELSGNLGWDDRLCARSTECALNAMDRQTRGSHASHQNRNFVGRQCDGSSGCLLDISDVIVEALIDRSGKSVSAVC